MLRYFDEYHRHRELSQILSQIPTGKIRSLAEAGGCGLAFASFVAETHTTSAGLNPSRPSFYSNGRC